MKKTIVLTFLAAIVIHGLILLFGGLLLFRSQDEAKVTEEVELFTEEAEEQAKKDDEADKEKAQEAAKEEPEETMEAQAEAAPDVSDLARLEAPAGAPALEALSLSDLEGVLDPGMGGGAFGDAFSLGSGGRIGGTGSGAAAGAELQAVFSVAELDQRPRPLFQAMPHYPPELRKRKVEGTVSVVFLVDTNGRVLEPKVEKSTDPAFERPALDAVRQWTFESGTKDGQAVQFKMRVPISFRAS